ncbi:MAG: hypothetical protein K8U57_34495 [Planctomycetes bacterium]|nr:hypothetical protein [Planctomycetota bacterium]
MEDTSPIPLPEDVNHSPTNPVPSPTPETVDAEFQKLCDHFPAFSLQEWEEERAWVAEQLPNGTLSGVLLSQLYGQTVAVYGRQIVSVGDDEVAMRVELSKRFNVHPGRFVLVLIDHRSHTDAAQKEPRWLILLFLIAIVVIVDIVSVTSLGTNANTTFSKIGTSPDVPVEQPTPTHKE